jgi:hypothetical protein
MDTHTHTHTHTHTEAITTTAPQKHSPKDLKEDTADTPHVHLEGIVAVGQQALWRSVPPRGDVPAEKGKKRKKKGKKGKKGSG